MSDKPLPPPTRRFLSGYSYTPEQQAEKAYYMKQLARDWPDVNSLWREWVYDFVVNTSEEELQKIMETVDEKESKFSPSNVQKMLAEYQKAS